MSLATPTLHTERLLLRPFTEADRGAIFATQSNPRVLRFWDSAPWKTYAQAEAFILNCETFSREGTGARLAIERALDGKFIGWCSLFHWMPAYRSAKLGYCFDDTVWGRGFATEASTALLQWAFITLDLNRVQAEVDTRNVASSRVLEKMRFIREGTLREDCIVEGVVSDSWVYGLLRREWAQLKSG
jgi:ribosomal-protein-alanine N-acetyltransferase